STNKAAYRSGFSIIKCTSRCARVHFRTDSTTGGPIVRFGTKCPSITSRWSIRAPPRSTRAISSARREKSADRIEGTISIICGLVRFYHSSKETVPRLASRQTLHHFHNPTARHAGDHSFILLFFDRTGRVDKQSSGSENCACLGQQGPLPGLKISQITGSQPPFDFRIATQRARSRAGCVHQNTIEP